MKKIKWGVMGTAFICERSTFPGMLQAENCEMYAIAGRNMEKAEQFKEKYGFDVIDHDLTFYGICKECQSSIQ